MELFEKIRREYEQGGGSIRGIAKKLGIHRRMVRACATITSCPNSLNNRLTHRECIPVSNAIRLRGMAPNTSFIAFGVAPSFCSSSTSALHPTRNTSSIDRLDPNRSSASAGENS